MYLKYFRFEYVILREKSNEAIGIIFKHCAFRPEVIFYFSK